MPKIQGSNLAENREIRRNQLIDAAMSLALESGVKSITVAAVASKAGLSRTAIYEYFSSSADLIVDLIMEELETYVNALRESVSTSQEPNKQIENWIRTSLQYVADGRHMLAKSLSSAVNQDFRHDEIAMAHRALAATVFQPLKDLGVVDIKAGIQYLQSVVDTASKRIDAGEKAAPEIELAIKFALAGIQALVS
jgi:AcrR family transcriptional regulator